jgi:hypothetical protein
MGERLDAKSVPQCPYPAVSIFGGLHHYVWLVSDMDKVF